MDEQQPTANAVAQKFLLGPGQGGRIQARFSGPDPATLRELGAEAVNVLRDDGGAVCVRTDWREPVKVIRPVLLDYQARRNGINTRRRGGGITWRAKFRRAPEVGFYREPGFASPEACFPRMTRFLPIIAPSTFE